MTVSQMKGSRGAQKGSNPNNTFDAIAPGVSQKLAFTGTSAAAATGFSANVSVVRLVATAACHVAFGTAPTAIADGTCVYLPPNVPHFFAVNPGDKVAAIQDTAGGNLFITEGAA